MSWRRLARDVQDTALDTFAERDEDDLLTTEVVPPAPALAFEVRAIFLDPFQVIDGEGRVQASTRELRADVLIADLVENAGYPPGPNWQLRIRRPLEGDPQDSTSAVTLLDITDWEPDGEGIVRLRLRKPRPSA